MNKSNDKQKTKKTYSVSGIWQLIKYKIDISIESA